MNRLKNTLTILFTSLIVSPLISLILSILIDYLINGKIIIIGALLYFNIVCTFIVIILPHLVFSSLKKLNILDLTLICIVNIIMFPLITYNIYFIYTQKLTGFIPNTFSFSYSTFIFLGIQLALNMFLFGLRAIKMKRSTNL